MASGLDDYSTREGNEVNLARRGNIFGPRWPDVKKGTELASLEKRDGLYGHDG